MMAEPEQLSAELIELMPCSGKLVIFEIAMDALLDAQPPA
jgi:hypothetical protein